MATLLQVPLQPSALSQIPSQKASNAAPKESKKDAHPPPEHIVHKTVDPVTGQERVVRRFATGRHLGQGAFGSCYEATDMETKHVYAVKVIAKSTLTKKSQQAKLLSEIKLHKASRHVNIVRFYDCFEDKVNVYIILELCPNMSLMQYMKRKKRLAESEARPFIAQVVAAVKYLHSHKIIHRDLKLANLLLAADMSIKIGDFGLATKLAMDGERKKTLCGTPNYIAPEILDKEVGHSFEVDIWAIGVVLFTLLTGRPPFETNDVNAVYERIKATRYAFPENIEISEEAKDLIRKMLTKQPELRPKLDDVMAHAWFAKDPSFRIRAAPLQDHAPYASSLASLLAYLLRTVPMPHATPSVFHTPHLSVMPANNKENDLAQLNAQMSRQTLGFTKPAPVSATTIFTPPPASLTLQSPFQKPQEKHVTLSDVVGLRRWIVNHEYCDMYGLVYVLSDRSVGMYYNDNTRLITDPSGRRGLYIDGNGPQHVVLDPYPPALKKKVTLLTHYRKQLLGDEIHYPLPEMPLDNDSMYLKKWVKTKQGTFFILSPVSKVEGEGVIQVNFTEDNTRVLLHHSGTRVTYADPLGVVSTQPLEDGNGPSDERLRSKLQYINQILFHLINPTP